MSALESTTTDSGGAALMSYTANDLWLEIALVNGAIRLTLHNTTPDVGYEILSRTDLVNGGWRSEQFLFRAAGQDWTQTILPLTGNRTVFFTAGISADTDGDGLTDTVEHFVTGTDPNNPDTGNTGVSDGYKDADGDGWTNLDELRNGTKPDGWNVPPGPHGLMVYRNPATGMVTLTWEPASGDVIGYTIFRLPVEIGYVGANVFTFSDPEPQSDFPDATVYSYQIRADYASGSSWSETRTFRQPGITPTFHVVRGPGGDNYLLTGNLPPSTASLRFSQWDWLTGLLAAPPLVLPATDFATGVYRIQELESLILDPFWNYLAVEAVMTDGAVGGAAPIYFWENEPHDNASVRFVDGTEHMKQNLKMLLQAALLDDSFRFGSFVGGCGSDWCFPLLERQPVNTDYEFAGYSTFSSQLEPFDPYLISERIEYWPWLENSILRNFLLSDQDFTAGRWNTGAGSAFYTSGDPPESFLIEIPWVGLGVENNPNEYIKYLLNLVDYTGVPNPWPTLLAPQTPRWFYSRTFNPAASAALGITVANGNTYSLASGLKNHFGLPLQSVKLGRWNQLPSEYPILLPGVPLVANGSRDFYATAFEEPVLQTVDYYFNTLIYSDYTASDVLHHTVPGHFAFQVTSVTPPLIIPFGQPSAFSGWAKQRIVNGDQNKFAYLGQYFDKAYKADPVTGQATTTETGILSEYGEFFPTEPGRVVLTTKFDPEQVGSPAGPQGSALVHVISLNVDANHDGTMDRTFAGPDNTTIENPFRFWVNDDHDFGNTETEKAPLSDGADTVVNSERDLEDFTRLWISGIPALPANSGYKVTLRFYSLVGSPAVRLFHAYEPDGGTAYLSDTQAAFNQANPFPGANATAYGTSIALLDSSTVYEFPGEMFQTYSRKHFLFEGAAAGLGKLVLTILKDGQAIAETSLYLQLQNIKEMYERAYTYGVKLAHPAMRNDLNPSSFGIEQERPSAPNETKQVIVHVHGFNNDYNQYISYADTMFKRLWWQGYRGRYCAFRWEAPTSLLRYNQGEYIAFRSANAAAGYFADLRQRFPDYSINATAHSMGNIVMMEALKLHLAAGSQYIDNYVLLEAAVSAHCYDPTAPNLVGLITEDSVHPTPDTYRSYPGGIDLAVNDSLENFFNPDDFALLGWVGNQLLKKPDGSVGYYIDPNIQPRLLPSTLLTDPREIMAFAARPRSSAVGAQVGVAGVIDDGQEFNLKVQLGFTGAPDDHSGQFNRNIQQVHRFYFELLGRMGIIGVSP